MTPSSRASRSLRAAAALLLVLAFAPPAAPQDPAALAGFTPEELARFAKRFEAELWPLFTRDRKSCVSCHDQESDSQLRLFDDPVASFRRLVVEGRFDADGPSSLLSRLTHADRKKRMPRPPAAAWTDAELALVRGFGAELRKVQRKDGPGMDERFPMELLTEFRGKPPASGPDTTFLTYYQLKRKVKAVFDDDWVRGGTDLFLEHLASFKGADFVRSFNESAVASASFLGGVDLLGADLATRAYLRGTGPFEGFAGAAASSPDDADRARIRTLFRRLLFREPSGREVDDAFGLLRAVAREEARLAEAPRELRFELRVEDADGLAGVREIVIPLTSGPCGLVQDFVDQNVKAEGPLARRRLDREFTFRAGDPEQQVRVLNGGSHGNVSVAGIELIGPLPSGAVRLVKVDDPSVRVLGAWTLKTDGFPSFEDRDENKGESSVVFPVRVDADGRYAVRLLWRTNDGTPETDGRGRPRPVPLNAERVRVEVLSHDLTRHAAEPPPEIPPPGEARFAIDQTLSNIPYWDLGVSFRFGPGDGVEIRNAGTSRTVVADAVHFARPGAPAFLVRGTEADGHDKWEEFKPGQFKPYNTFGPKLLSDDNRKKGELALLYRPSVRKAEWKEDVFYVVRLSCPGKAGNETQAPVVVRARASSPIVQVRHPAAARSGGELRLDASASYTLQRSPLRFTWTQTGGPAVELEDRHATAVSFIAPRMGARQAGWEGLCRALLRHPDFLFTRPPSAAVARDPAERRRLLLVKIAQDLVGRTPGAAELRRLEEGAPLESFVDEYLESAEFRDFYFRRIRLVLESHGSESDDEPTRLWCYVAFNDRPFKEILTADYTVDREMQRRERPAHHGKTGLLTMKGFIDGKPGLPHFNYAAVVLEKFMGYVFEVPATIVAQREGATAASTTHPDSTCYSCHKVLTPLAFQRLNWTDEGKYVEKDEHGAPVDASDRGLVASYPFKGNGMEAFALGAQNKERFIRTMIQTHFIFFFGRELRWEDDERGLYRRLWDAVAASNYSIRALIRGMLTSPEYLGGAQ